MCVCVCVISAGRCSINTGPVGAPTCLPSGPRREARRGPPLTTFLYLRPALSLRSWGTRVCSFGAAANPKLTRSRLQEDIHHPGCKLTALILRFYPKRFATLPDIQPFIAHTHTPTAVSTMQGDSQLVGSS